GIRGSRVTLERLHRGSALRALREVSAHSLGGLHAELVEGKLLQRARIGTGGVATHGVQLQGDYESNDYVRVRRGLQLRSKMKDISSFSQAIRKRRRDE